MGFCHGSNGVSSISMCGSFVWDLSVFLELEVYVERWKNFFAVEVLVFCLCFGRCSCFCMVFRALFLLV